MVMFELQGGVSWIKTEQMLTNYSYTVVRRHHQSRNLTLVDSLREGDSLVITKLDRLARSTFHLTQIANQLEEKSVDFVVLDQHIDTSTPTGKLLFNMLASIAGFETEICKERQLEGIEKAKCKGVKF